MKKLILLALLAPAFSCSAQQFAIYNTRTLFDSFENPSQKAFIADTSRQYAFNFFIPTASANAVSTGPGQTAIKNLAYLQEFNANGLKIGAAEKNRIFIHSNIYLGMFKIFKDVKYNRELGFSWQIKSDTHAKVTNGTLGIFTNINTFTDNQYNNIFNNSGSSQNYHQFSFTYREDLNKRTGLGIKLSYLSGIAYNKLEINSSSLNINKAENRYDLSIDGNFKSSYYYDGLGTDILTPGLKNPGFAFTASANYKMKGGWYLLGNLKDVGLIHWSKESYYYPLSYHFTIDNASASDTPTRLNRLIGDKLSHNYSQKGFTSLLNSKAEILINKDLDIYQPNLLVSAGLFYPGTDIALIHSFRVKKSGFSLVTDYNTNRYWQIGGQYLYKAPNFEFFIGSDQIFKTYYSTKGFITQDADIGKGNTATSFYLGFSLKFGNPMEHQANASAIPGFGKDADRPGFFKRLFGKKKKE